MITFTEEILNGKFHFVCQLFSFSAELVRVNYGLRFTGKFSKVNVFFTIFDNTMSTLWIFFVFYMEVNNNTLLSPRHFTAIKILKWVIRSFVLFWQNENFRLCYHFTYLILLETFSEVVLYQNGCVFVYELSGCGLGSRRCHLNLKYCAYFEQGVPWHSVNIKGRFNVKRVRYMIMKIFKI